ncbi:hypothetical protein B0H15DRAFT_930268 [Mycena belliarum]|uniref:Mid2 domain-containing protein n=1 Tax=Mycena belliarum TaxID=1033014 RepID=A0AAD6UAH5_9AGAR|nr:hypothetical protein B0H15DRAFT_930268 [Mycena belliae]
MPWFIPSTGSLHPLLFLALSLQFISGAYADNHDNKDDDDDDKNLTPAQRRLKTIIAASVVGGIFLLVLVAWGVFLWRRKRVRARAWAPMIPEPGYQGTTPSGPYALQPTGYGQQVPYNYQPTQPAPQAYNQW